MIFNILHDQGIHEKKLSKYFGRHAVYDGPQVFEYPLLLLGFTNRCGSNLLAGYLRSLPEFSGFNEQLNFDSVMRWSNREGVRTFPDYIQHVSRKKPRYGFKASADQIAMLFRFGITRMYPSVRVLHIRRRDVLAQAVSYSIADQTKQWISSHEKQGEASYDRKDIEGRLNGFARQNEALRIAAQVFGYAYESVDYEDLTADSLGTVQKACRFFGTAEPEALGAPWVERQGDSVNQRFIELYCRDVFPG
ncbi:Stf0 family sulfotransferase [Nioella nitratireducens]|uniref:Stf0 family sulfotransferase n=1 Tax=Nioella nitratireducens TaxID=1287720 RepID=UPI0008FCE0D5|nr:Stf0 family sulfotransferase [Nioella nitratireducens]